MSMPARKGYLPTLDGWRAIAILGVIVAHGSWAWFEPGGPLANAAAFRLTRYGAMGVDVFFGISGFLICSRLLEEWDARGRISLAGFYVRRVFRILPPYYFYLACLALLTAMTPIAVSNSEWITSVFFVRNYLPTDAVAATYTGHLWSLAVEEHFYLLFPTILVLLTPSRARIGVLALALGIGLWRVIEFRLGFVQTLIPNVGFYDRTDIRLDGLFWGCWVALLLHHPEMRRRAERMATTAAWLVAVSAFILIVALQPPLALLWQALLIPLIVVGTVLNPGTAVGRALESRGMRWIGRLSYSLYLWQTLFLRGTIESPALGWLQLPPVSLVCVFAAAAFSYYIVERPAIRMGHRIAHPVTPGRTQL